MIDKPVSPAGNTPATFSPLVRAVIEVRWDSVHVTFIPEPGDGDA